MLSGLADTDRRALRAFLDQITELRRERDHERAMAVSYKDQRDALASQLVYEREQHKRCSDQDGNDRLAAIERAEKAEERVHGLTLDVLELDARLRLVKDSAISVAQTAQTALVRLEDYTEVVRCARDWYLPLQWYYDHSLRKLAAAVERLEERLAKKVSS